MENVQSSLKKTSHTLRPLTMAQIGDIYSRYMKKDFPPSELRPLRSIRELSGEGRYRGLGLFDGGTLLGYALLISLERAGETHYLLDYFSVVPERRDMGLGSEFLALLPGALRDGSCVIGEVEDPDLEQDPAERRTKERRMQFYTRAGFRDTGACTSLFGVDFRLLQLPLLRALEPEEAAALYRAIYRSVLPEWLFRTQVRVTIPEREGEEHK